MLRAGGHPEYIIKQILGHKRTDMTTGTHYHGATEDQLRAAIESIRLR
jgi:hypothetical protein